jgi:hypothetical protein
MGVAPQSLTPLTLRWFSVCLLLASCGPSTKGFDPEGEYVYRSKWGQVEMLRIEKDDSFTHELYDNEKSFISGSSPLFSRSGKIANKGGRRVAKLLDLGMLIYGPVRSEPELIWRSNVVPISPVAYYRPGFNFSEQDFYCLLKVNARSEISALKFQYP